MVTFISILNIINNLWPKSFTVNGANFMLHTHFDQNHIFFSLLKELSFLISIKSDVKINNIIIVLVL